MPYVEVVVDVAEATYEDARATVVGALTGTMTDVAVTLVGPWSALTDERRSPLDDPVLDLRLLREAFAGDGRVRYVESVPETSFPAPFRFRCPAGVVPALDGLRRLIEEADERRVGLVLLPIPRDRMLPIARLERTEAMARAIALREGDEDLEDVIHELFGVHWISGSEWALVLANEVPQQVGLLAEVDKWKTAAEQRKTDLAKVKAELREWRKVAQTPLKVRLRHARQAPPRQRPAHRRVARCPAAERPLAKSPIGPARTSAARSVGGTLPCCGGSGSPRRPASVRCTAHPAPPCWRRRRRRGGALAVPAGTSGGRSPTARSRRPGGTRPSGGSRLG